MLRHVSSCVAAAAAVALVAITLSWAGAQSTAYRAVPPAKGAVSAKAKAKEPRDGRRSARHAHRSEGNALLAARWVPASPKAYERAKRPDSQIKRIIIHVAQAPAGSVVNTFQNGNVAASSHYVVSADGEVIHMVPDRSIAWHAGNSAYNATSIGIEHAGYVEKKGSLTKPMYRASAGLVAHLANEYEIPIDRSHVIGHNEVPDPNDPRARGGYDGHTDPGPHWKWRDYMSSVRQAARTEAEGARAEAGGPSRVAAAGPETGAKGPAENHPVRAKAEEPAG